MNIFTSDVTLLLLTALFGFLAYKLALGRIRLSAANASVKPHSLAQYYGVYAALWTLVPALILALIWAFAADPLILNAAEARLRNAYPILPASFLDLKLAQLQNIAAGYIDAPDDIMANEADKLRASMKRVELARVLTLLSVMMIGFLFAFHRVNPQLKARIAYEGFLRRCFFHFINFPDRETMQQIVDVHFPEIKKDLVKEAMEIFFDVRKVPGLKKKPSTSELIDWLKLLMADDIPDEILTNRDASKAIPPLYGALVKNEQDVHLLERLAFMNRRDSRG